MLGDSGASVSLELALVSTLFLVPLLIFTTDGFFAFAAKTQTESALQSLFFYGWSDPTDATDLTSLQKILNEVNQHSTIRISFAPNYQPQYSYACLTDSGDTVAAQSTSGSNGATQETCSSGSLETFVRYDLVASVPLTLPFPGVPNPMTVNVGGSVRVQ